MKCYSYIRFSSPEQAKGSSYERQFENAKQYAKEKGWDLDERLSMFDPGLSGFHQANTTKGELGLFLKAVSDGKIETPSALLVENLDRLSRATIPEALRQFLDLMAAGITIVTLIDRQEYSKETIEQGMNSLIISISIMHRAHEESVTKQHRRSKSWELNRKKAREGIKFKAMCPSWLNYSEKKQQYIEYEERVKVVKRIFDLYIAGYGLNTICKTLNDEKIKTFSTRSSRWWVSYIRKILSSRSVFGEIQFMKTVQVKSGKRITEPDGDPIENYYPTIIEKEIFLKAQNLKDNRFTPFGRIGEANNLFTKISKCGYCGATMYYNIRSRNKIPYLSCSSSMVKKCKIPFKSFRYKDFEEAFLEQCNKIDIHSIITDKEDDISFKINNSREKILIIEDDIRASQKKIENYEAAINSFDSTNDDTNENTIKYFAQKIHNELQNQSRLSQELKRWKARIAILSGIIEETSKTITNTRNLIEEINKKPETERIAIRRQLQHQIKQLVEKIEFFPAGVLGSNNNKHSKKDRHAVAYFKGGGELHFMNAPNQDSLISITK
jgi:hypothetical protein